MISSPTCCVCVASLPEIQLHKQNALFILCQTSLLNYLLALTHEAIMTPSFPPDSILCSRKNKIRPNHAVVIHILTSICRYNHLGQSGSSGIDERPKDPLK
jgi:hypothetical protein